MPGPAKCLIGLLFGLLVFGVTRGIIEERTRRAKELEAEGESIQALAQAKSKAELMEAVGHLGIFLPLKDGSWIAIRSLSVRSHPLWSSSVALDGKGNWLRSNNYLSGIFKIYMDQKVRVLELPAEERETWLAELCPYVHPIATAPTLEAAHQAMDVLGFEPFDPGVHPAFREK